MATLREVSLAESRSLDLTKAFNIVNRDGCGEDDEVYKDWLWKIMSKFWCPKKFIMDRLFLKGMEVRVKDNDEFSEPFPDTNGVK